jgi:hypothetical protein
MIVMIQNCISGSFSRMMNIMHFAPRAIQRAACVVGTDLALGFKARAEIVNLVRGYLFPVL